MPIGGRHCCASDAYQPAIHEFLYGEMLAWGVCVDKDIELGFYYIQSAAHQGLLAALEQLGRYYSRGTIGATR